jgi:DNA invertase Pin-like site-specific DNA recombinase
MNTQSKFQIAYAYSRFSTPEQAEGDSLHRQQSKAQSWAKDNSLRIEYLHDAGVSAYRGKNRTLGQLGTFLERLRDGSLGANPVLLVENFDRLSREAIEEAQGLFLELINRGAAVVTLHNSKVYRRPLSLVDIIMALVEMDVAHQESAKKAERVAAAWEQKRSTKQRLHAKTICPLWLQWNAENNAFEPNPQSTKTVTYIFEMAASGTGSHAIARRLNAERVPTFRSAHDGSQAEQWYPKSIRLILANRAVLGEYRPGKYIGRKRHLIGDVWPAYFPRIITNELWDAVSSEAGKRARGGPGKPSENEHNLLRKIANSGIDGSPMLYRRGRPEPETRLKRRYNYLVSKSSFLGRTPRHSVRYEVVEDRVLWLARNIDPTIFVSARLASATEHKLEIEMATAETEAANRHLAKLTRLLASTDANDIPETFMQALKAAETSRKAAQARLEGAKTSAGDCIAIEFSPDAEDLITREGRTNARAKLARWCDHIVVNRDSVEVWFSLEQGVTINLFGEPIAHGLNVIPEDETDPLLPTM